MINILHLHNSREKACSNCGWKHQCKCYYAFPVLSHIGCWHRSVSLDCQWQGRSVVYWLSRVIWSHWPHPRKSPSELLCGIIAMPSGTFAVWQLTPEIDWMASDHICTSHHPSWNLRLPGSSGLTSYCLSFTGELSGLCSLAGALPAPLFAYPLFASVRRLFMRLHEERSVAVQTAFPVVTSSNLIKRLAGHFSLCVWIIHVVKI